MQIYVDENTKFGLLAIYIIVMTVDETGKTVY